MFTALLLPLLAAGSPVVGTRVAQTDDPTVQLWISNDRRFFQSDRATVQLRTRNDGYVVVLHADPDGHLRVLAPVDPNDDNFVRGGKKYEVKGRGAREAFTVEVSSGRGTVYAAYSAAPFSFAGYVLGDHWDYRTLAPDRLPSNPETELTDIVRRMATGSFDYDILTYDVLGEAYADNSYYGSSYGASYGYYDNWCCSGFSIGLSFGAPFYPYRPYYHHYGYYPAYSPFYYDPFFYDPFYYRPVYYSPYRPYYYGYYRPYSGYYPYHGHGGTYWGGYPGSGYRPYTPYRFRGNTVIAAGNGGRTYGFRRAVNTVYSPPVTRLREPDNAQPARRVVNDRLAADPANNSNRRQVAQSGSRARDNQAQPSVNRRGVEARRTREPDARQRSEAPMPVQVGPGARRSTDQLAQGASEPSVNRRGIEARRAREPDARQRSEAPMPVQVGPGARRSTDRGAMSLDRPTEIQARPARPVESRPEPVRAEPRSYGGERATSSHSDGGRRSAVSGGGGGGGGGDGGRRSAGGGGGGGGSHGGGSGGGMRRR
ncbi:MAG: DUF4384 domain-containing protein [Gemmatimonadales bacterium]